MKAETAGSNLIEAAYNTNSRSIGCFDAAERFSKPAATLHPLGL
jgi:hypothetical protein